MNKRLMAGVLTLTSCSYAGPSPESALVYQYIGSKQCEGGGTAVDTMVRKLEQASIQVTDTQCGNDGRMYAAMCGAPDGRIAILEIPAAKVTAATALGFAPLNSLPGATKTVCPKTP